MIYILAIRPSYAIVKTYSPYITTRASITYIHAKVALLKLDLKAAIKLFQIGPSSFLAIFIDTEYKAVSDAPIVTTGIQQSIKIIFKANILPNVSTALYTLDC
jgi:hypothetical protein